MSATATPADVLSGKARWCVVEGDNAEVLPTLPDKSVAHVITDPPYEAEAHTLQRRVKRGDGDGENSKWGGGGRTPCTSLPSRFRPSTSPGVGGWLGVCPVVVSVGHRVLPGGGRDEVG